MKLEPVILQQTCKKDSRGHKLSDPREVLSGVLWGLRTGAPWKDLPDRISATPDPSPTIPVMGKE